MTGAEALLYFTTQVAVACSQLNVTMPDVKAIRSEERSRMSGDNVVAYVAPKYWWKDHEEIDVLWSFLWTADKKTLRCTARHEVAHLALGHGICFGQDQCDRNHAKVAELMRKKWDEDSRCGLQLVKRRKVAHAVREGGRAPTL